MRNGIYIPPSEKSAKKHLERALAAKLERLPKGDFMKAYCSLAYRYPGFHPDGIENWNGPQEILRVAREAWRRAEAGELSDNELYPYQASKAAISQARKKDVAQRPTVAAARKR